MKNHKKKAPTKKIKYSITVWMVVSIALLTTLVFVRAAYNGTADVKRVVSTQSSSRKVFSSNYMEGGGVVVKNLRTTSEGDFICNVTVCNYDQLDPTTPARSLITYDMVAELVKFDQTTQTYVGVSQIQTRDDDTPEIFYIKKVMENNEEIDTDTMHDLNTGSFTYTYAAETLAGGTSYKDSFNLCFDRSEVAKEMPELFIRVTAIPTPESSQLNSGVTTLSSIISISKGRTVETGWHGSLNESGREDYDGYNLIIEGSGKGTIDILWDSREFSINPAFIENNASRLRPEVDMGEGWKKRTLIVDSTEENRYVVQFYKKKENVYYTGTNFPSKYIICNGYVADE